MSFQIIKIQSICQFTASIALHMTFKQFSPFRCIGDLSLPCRKIGQRHPRVMIYTNFVDLYSQMFHAKFQNQRPPGSYEEYFKTFVIYSHGGHLHKDHTYIFYL